MAEDTQKTIEGLDELISELVEERKVSPVGRVGLERKIERLRKSRSNYKAKLERGEEE